MPEESPDRPSSKVARLIDEYGLDGLGDELESRWTAENDERMSLRDLASFFNKRLLEEVLLMAGMSTLETDVERVYHRLTDEDVSPGVRTETRNRLDQNGVDVEKLEKEFVSYQAIRSYLQEWREATYNQLSDEEKINNDLESIQRLMNRTESVARDRIGNLNNTGRIEAENFEIFLNMQVLCQQCGEQYDIATFLTQGGCDCSNKI